MMARVASARLILFTHAAAGPSHPTSNYYQSIASFTVYLTALSSTIRQSSSKLEVVVGNSDSDSNDYCQVTTRASIGEELYADVLCSVAYV